MVDNLQSILRNKTYLGIKVYRVKGEERESKAVWPAIVDESTFIRVGKLLDKNRQRLKPWKKGRMPYILSGTVQCLKCGSHMPGKSATGGGGKVGYKDREAALMELSMGGQSAKDRVVGLDTFSTFASSYKCFLSKDASVPERKQAVQKFIRKVEVSQDTIRIHFIVDEDHFKRKLASKEADSHFNNFSSNTLTFGAPGQT